MSGAHSPHSGVPPSRPRAACDAAARVPVGSAPFHDATPGQSPSALPPCDACAQRPRRARSCRPLPPRLRVCELRRPRALLITSRHSSLSPVMDTPLSTIAVVGLGTMGGGIAEVLARAGREVIGIDTSETAARGSGRRPEAATARSVARELGSARRSGATSSPGSDVHRPPGRGRRRPGHRGGPRVVRAEAAGDQRAGRGPAARGDHRDGYQRAVGDPAGRRSRRTRNGCWGCTSSTRRRR